MRIDCRKSRARGRLSLVAMACLVTIPALAAGTWAPARKLDTWLDALQAQQLASLSVAVSEKGKLRFQRSIGFATIENGRPQPADEATRYRAGPVSSLFTAVLFMQRVETGSITLDHPLVEFFADVPNAANITYRDLLGHRSGLADYTRTAGFETWRLQPRGRDELLARITADGIHFAPGELTEHNDSNYLLLGLVLEKITDQSHDDMVLRQIVEKLGFFRTYFAGTANDTFEALPYRYTPAGWEQLPVSDPTVAGGANGIVSTPVELVRFIDAIFSGRLVSARSLQSMQGLPDGPALGLASRQVGGETGYGHAGAFDGYTASVYHFPDRGISIACMSNASRLPMPDLVEQVMTSILVRGHQPMIPTTATAAE